MDPEGVATMVLKRYNKVFQEGRLAFTAPIIEHTRGLKSKDYQALSENSRADATKILFERSRTAR
jgi:hypothetical protein